MPMVEREMRRSVTSSPAVVTSADERRREANHQPWEQSESKEWMTAGCKIGGKCTVSSYCALGPSPVYGNSVGNTRPSPIRKMNIYIRLN